MTWSRTTAGPSGSVIAVAELWPAELVASAGDDAAVAAGQYKQASRVLETVKAFADRAPSGYQITVSAGGHAAGDNDSADSFYVNLGTYRPVPVAAGARGS